MKIGKMQSQRLKRAIDLYKVDRGITANKASNNDKEVCQLK